MDSPKIAVLGASRPIGGLSADLIVIDECVEQKAVGYDVVHPKDNPARRTGVAKARRLARKKRAQKIARRR